jgi:hypothetical protein
MIRFIWRQYHTLSYNSSPFPVFSRTSLLALNFSSELCLHFWTRGSNAELWTPELFVFRSLGLLSSTDGLSRRHLVQGFLFHVFDATVASVMVTAGTELVLYPLPKKQFAYVFVVAWTCLQLSPRQRCSYRSRCLAMGARSDCDIPAFRRHVAVC